MKTTRKVLSALLVSLLLVSLLPATAFAADFYDGNPGANETYAKMQEGLVPAEDDSAVAYIYVWDDPTTQNEVFRKLYYNSIDAAIKAAAISVDFNAGTPLCKLGAVTLIKDLTLTGDIVLPLTFTYGGNNSITFVVGENYVGDKLAAGYPCVNHDITVDLNGYTVRHATENRPLPSTYFGYNGYAEFYVENNATMTLIDSAGGGRVLGPNAAVWVEEGGILDFQSGTLCVSADENNTNGGSYQQTTFKTSFYYGILNYGTVNLNGGTIDLRGTTWTNPDDPDNYHTAIGICQYDNAVLNWNSGSVLSDAYAVFNTVNTLAYINDTANGDIVSEGKFYSQSDNMTFITIPRSITYNRSAVYQTLPAQSLISVYQDYFNYAEDALKDGLLTTNVYQFFHGANAIADTTHGVGVSCSDPTASAADRAIALSAVSSADGDFFFSDDLKTLNFKVDHDLVNTLSAPTTITIQVCVGGGAAGGTSAYDYSDLHFHVAYAFTMTLAPYVAPKTVDATLTGVKTLTENGEPKAIEEDQFTVAISAADTNDKAGYTGFAAGSKAVAADGSFSFDPIEFVAAGIYKFTVSENNLGAAGYTYDNQAVTVTVDVRINEETNALYIDSIVYTKGGAAADGILFKNTYSAITPPTPQPNPKTGDTSNIYIYTAVILSSVCGMLSLVLYKKRSKHSK